MHISTRRLTIRRLLPGDWPALSLIAADFADGPYARYDHTLPSDEEGIRAAAESFASTGEYYAALLPDGRMAGYIRLALLDGEAELGYCFHSAFHGQGYASEACSALMDALTKEEKVFSFVAGTALRNEPSCRLLERLGFVLVETGDVSFHKDENGQEIFFEAGLFVKPA